MSIKLTEEQIKEAIVKMNNSEEYMSAKDAFDDLKKHFNSFREGYWYDADDI